MVANLIVTDWVNDVWLARSDKFALKALGATDVFDDVAEKKVRPHTDVVQCINKCTMKDLTFTDCVGFQEG